MAALLYFIKMKKCLLLLAAAGSVMLSAQYAPPAGQPGSEAIPADSPLFKAWAKNAQVTRGPRDIAANDGLYAEIGTPQSATGAPDGVDVVSLGDGGSAVVTFDKPIMNGPGADFAVFENAFNDTFLEIAFVEVSSDGVHFFRFPAVSLTPTDVQVGGFGSVDTTKLHNFAGKYKSMFGTPFNLDDIPDNPLLNKNAVTHVKIIDVIGTINPQYATYDSLGNIVNDPYNTPYASCGFDLDAVGVIHQNESLSVAEFQSAKIKVYPNPVSDYLHVESPYTIKEVKITDFAGRSFPIAFSDSVISVSHLAPGQYIVQIVTEHGTETVKLIKK